MKISTKKNNVLKLWYILPLLIIRGENARQQWQIKRRREKNSTRLVSRKANGETFSLHILRKFKMDFSRTCGFASCFWERADSWGDIVSTCNAYMQCMCPYSIFQCRHDRATPPCKEGSKRWKITLHRKTNKNLSPHKALKGRSYIPFIRDAK